MVVLFATLLSPCQQKTVLDHSSCLTIRRVSANLTGLHERLVDCDRYLLLLLSFLVLRRLSTYWIERYSGEFLELHVQRTDAQASQEG
jgi:hypothetical protein